MTVSRHPDRDPSNSTSRLRLDDIHSDSIESKFKSFIFKNDKKSKRLNVNAL